MSSWSTGPQSRAGDGSRPPQTRPAPSCPRSCRIRCGRERHRQQTAGESDRLQWAMLTFGTFMVSLPDRGGAAFLSSRRLETWACPRGQVTVVGGSRLPAPRPAKSTRETAITMLELTFLGTSARVPSAERNHPSVLVEAGRLRILADCGEGTQRQLLRSGAGFRRLDRILRTHAHSTTSWAFPVCFRL
jgi:hypothetical protein